MPFDFTNMLTLEQSISKSISNNFALTSAIAVILGTLISVLYYYSYLLFFDGSLIKFVEYGDIGKLAIFGISVVSIFIPVLVLLMKTAADYFDFKHRISKVIYIASAGILIAGMMTWRLHQDLGTNQAGVDWYASFALAALACLIVAFQQQYSIRKMFFLSDIVPIILLTSGVCFWGGLYIGLSTRDTPTALYDIRLKTVDGSTVIYHDAILISVLTKNTLLYISGKSIVIPNDSIAEYKSHSVTR